jgi:hypothetical protein
MKVYRNDKSKCLIGDVFTFIIINMISSIEEAANNIPLLTIHAGPKDEKWKDRLKEELKAIILYVKSNKQQDNDWFKI